VKEAGQLSSGSHQDWISCILFVGAFLCGSIALIAIVLWVEDKMFPDLTEDSTGELMCYGIKDNSGVIHRSTKPAYFSNGLWYYSTEDEWGWVSNPQQFYADRECLKAKGVIE
jgi:hypothetical protein